MTRHQNNQLSDPVASEVSYFSRRLIDHRSKNYRLIGVEDRWEAKEKSYSLQ